MEKYHFPAGPPVKVYRHGREIWERRADPARQFFLIFGRYAIADEVRALPEPGMYDRECDYLSALQTWLTRPDLYKDHLKNVKESDAAG